VLAQAALASFAALVAACCFAVFEKLSDGGAWAVRGLRRRASVSLRSPLPTALFGDQLAFDALWNKGKVLAECQSVVVI
jgi:hypothetical protein